MASFNTPFKVKPLSSNNLFPLQILANLTDTTYYDFVLSQIKGTPEEFKPSSSASTLLYDFMGLPQKGTSRYSDLPDFLKTKPNSKEGLRNIRNQLWIKVTEREKRTDAQFAKLFELALPFGLDPSLSKPILQKFSDYLTEKGMVSEIAVREEADGRQNAYIMATSRPFKNGVFMNKDRDWNTRKFFFQCRGHWFSLLKAELSQAITASPENPANPNFESWIELSKRFILPDENQSIKELEVSDDLISMGSKPTPTLVKKKRL